MDSAKSRQGAVISLLITLTLIPFLTLYFGYELGVHSTTRKTTVVNSPTTAAPFAYSCDHGVKVYTTPQGGIALFPGGKDCP